MRRDHSNTRALAHSGDHSPKRLPASSALRVLSAAYAVVLRDPLLNLDGADMVIEVGLQRPKARAELIDDIGIKREPVPVLPLTKDPRTPADEIQVSPPARDDLGIEVPRPP